jgi:heme exporter protein D
MATFLRLLAWIGPILGIVLAGLAVAYLLLRRRILRHVAAELGRETLLLATAARVGASNGAAASSPASVGVLMLLSNGLYFHSWVGSREVFVPGPSISWIGVSDARGAPRSERHRILVRFLNAAGKEDGITIRLLYPEEWVAAIKTHLITRAS